MEKNESFNQFNLNHETIDLAPDAILFAEQDEFTEKTAPENIEISKKNKVSTKT